MSDLRLNANLAGSLPVAKRWGLGAALLVVVVSCAALPSGTNAQDCPYEPQGFDNHSFQSLGNLIVRGDTFDSFGGLGNYSVNRSVVYEPGLSIDYKSFAEGVPGLHRNTVTIGNAIRVTRDEWNGPSATITINAQGVMRASHWGESFGDMGPFSLTGSLAPGDKIRYWGTGEYKNITIGGVQAWELENTTNEQMDFNQLFDNASLVTICSAGTFSDLKGVESIQLILAGGSTGTSSIRFASGVADFGGVGLTGTSATAVPEPSSWIASLGIVALLARRRSRNSTKC